MKGIARVGIDQAGGVILGGGQDFVRIDGDLVAVLGDGVAAHGEPPHSPQPVMVEGESWVTVNGKPVCRAGHKASCGHASTGCEWLGIGPPPEQRESQRS